MVAMAGRGLLGLGVPYFFGDTIGLIAAGAPREEVIAGATRLVALSLGTAFCQFWMRWLFIGASRRFECRLRDALFEHISRLSFGYFNRMRTGDVMSRLTADVEAVRMGVGPGVMHLFQTGIMAIGAVIIMLSTYWQLTAIALVPMLLIFVVMRLLTPRLHDSSLRVQEQLSTLSSMAQESFSGARVVKAFAREDYEIGRFEHEADTYIHDSMRLAMTRGKMHALIEVMAGLVTVAVLFFGGRAVITGQLEFGPFVSFFGYFMMMVWPMIALGWTLALFQRAKVAMARLDDVFAVTPEIDAPNGAPYASGGAQGALGRHVRPADAPDRGDLAGRLPEEPGCAVRRGRAGQGGPSGGVTGAAGRVGPVLTLLGDIGGTNARFARYDGDTLGPTVTRSVADFPQPLPAIRDVLDELADLGGAPPQAALFAVAGPVEGGRAALTNGRWAFEADDLRKELGLASSSSSRTAPTGTSRSACSGRATRRPRSSSANRAGTSRGSSIACASRTGRGASSFCTRASTTWSRS